MHAISPAFCRLPLHFAASRPRCLPPLARAVRVQVMASPVFDIAVKGDAETNTLGDCPFSHRALLTLEEKNVPYVRTYVDLAAKPHWLLEVNPPRGTVPAMKDVESGKWIVDSDVIVDYLEDRFPEPALGTAADSPQVGNAIFSAWIGYSKASDEEEADKAAALKAAVQELEDYLQQQGGPYIGGAAPCATDLSLMPKLYHITTALEHFRGWRLLADFPAVEAYMAAFMQRQSWRHTQYSPEIVIEAWSNKGVQVKK